MFINDQFEDIRYIGFSPRFVSACIQMHRSGKFGLVSWEQFKMFCAC